MRAVFTVFSNKTLQWRLNYVHYLSVFVRLWFQFNLDFIFFFVVLFSFCLPFVVVQNQGKFVFDLLGLLWSYDESCLGFLVWKMLTVFERSLIVRREIRFRSCESVLLKYIKCCLNASCMACLNLHGVVFFFHNGNIKSSKACNLVLEVAWGVVDSHGNSIWGWMYLFKVCSLLTKCE